MNGKSVLLGHKRGEPNWILIRIDLPPGVVAPHFKRIPDCETTKCECECDLDIIRTMLYFMNLDNENFRPTTFYLILEIKLL